MVTSEREARSEFLFGLWEKSKYERPDPAQPHDAFQNPIALQPCVRLTSGLHSWIGPFSLPRLQSNLTHLGDEPGVWHVPHEGCQKYSLGYNSEKVWPIVLKSGI